jgi:hypothetical protein
MIPIKNGDSIMLGVIINLLYRQVCKSAIAAIRQSQVRT